MQTAEIVTIHMKVYSAKSRRYCLYVQDFIILIIKFLLF